MPTSPKSSGLHLAIIPDGNRRWAREHLLESVWKGHEKAVENFVTLSEWCRNDPRVSILTVWCFSTENWKRDPKEISELMKLLETYLRREQKNFEKKQTRFVHSGRRDRIPPSLKQLIEESEEQTKNFTGFTLHLAVDYGGKDEVVRAIHKIPANRYPLPASTDESVIRQYLDHPELPDIDVILRSSGEQRTSNFFLWQSAYAEWVFSPKYFPDIGTDDLDEALGEYERRKRRFGG
ncbi:MAG: polyprenyl diphosphate synthase [Candidatus Peribacteraceae bacterium]